MFAKKKVERSDAKIECCDCKNLFHSACVKILPVDLDFMRKNKKTWRCSQCTSSRRNSLAAESVAISATPKNTGETTTNDNSQQQIQEKETIDLKLIYSEIIELKNVNKDFLSRISELQTENSELKSKVSALQDKINLLEQSNLSNTMEIVNVPCVDNSNAMQVAVDIVRDGLGVQISEKDIDHCYVKKIKGTKKGKQIGDNASSNDNTNILVIKLIRRQTKENIMRAKRSVKLTAKFFGERFDNTNIYINDGLTPYVRELFNATKKIKVTKKYKFIWVRKNLIFLRKKEGDDAIKVRCFEDIINL